MKKMKRLLAITLSVAMICGGFAVIEPDEAEAAMPTTEYFNETFNTDGSFDNETWSSNSTNLETWQAAVSGGKLTIPSDNATAVYLMVDDDELMAKSDYAVSCKVQFSSTLPEDRTTVTNIGLVARTGNVNNQGYEFQLTIPADDTEQPYVRIRDRVAGKYFTGVKRLSDFDYTEENVFKIECRGDEITCSINGDVCLTYTISDTGRYAGYNAETDAGTDNDVYTNVYSSGTTAIRMASTNVGVNVTFDDFKVSYTADYKFCDDFNGYDGEAASDRKYAALNANGWYVSDEDDYANAGLLTGDAYIVPATNTTTPIILQTENAKGALGWNDYSVEADITIGESEDTSLTGAVYACVTGRHTVTGGTDGYEIQLYDNGNGTQRLRIYRRNKDSQGELANCNFDIVYGQTYNLKAVFQDNTIYAYVDDVLYLEHTDEDATNPIGFAGIRKMGATSGATVTFDNFVVYDYDLQPYKLMENFDAYVPKLVQVGDTENYDNSLLIKKGWGKNPNSALRAYAGNYIKDGVFYIPRGNQEDIDMVLSNHSTAANWENYTTECDVTFHSQGDNVTSGDYTYVYVSAMNDAYDHTGGYSLRLGAMNTGKLRYIDLYQGSTKLTTGTTLSTNTTGETETTGAWDLSSTNRIEKGNVLHVKIEFNGTTIKATVTGADKTFGLEHTLSDDVETPVGYVGLHTRFSAKDSTTTVGGVDVTFDNLEVYNTINTYVKEIVGDILVDDVVNKDDTNAVKQYLLGTELDAETHDTDALDVNKDTAKNISDYVRMLRLVDSLN